MKSLFSVAFLFFVGLQAYSQSGNYFLSNYTPSTDNIDHVSFGIAQSDKGVLYFATKNGVVEFDGKNWNLISTPGAIFTIFTSGNEILVGGVKGLGKLGWDKDRHHTFQNISEDHPEAITIFSGLATKDKAYFINENSLFIVSLATLKIESVVKSSQNQEVFTGLFNIFGGVYITTDTGLLKVENGKLVAAALGLPINEKLQLAATLKNSDKSLLIGTSGKFYLSSASGKAAELKLTDAAYLDNNVLLNATWVTENLIAIGTLRGGIFFFNPTTGATEEITNYYTGLPDNEVYAIYTDRDMGVWAAHDYGFSRVAPYLPFRSYSHYQGLAGNLLCVRSYLGQVYVGTTLGLFKLSKEEVYEEQVYYLAKQQNIASTQAKAIVAAPAEEPRKRSGLLSFLKKKKVKEEKVEPVQGEAIAKPAAKAPILERKTRRVLKNLQYAFKKVNGVEGKVNQLMEVNGKLVASGLAGVYEIDGLSAKTIIQDPVVSVSLSVSLKQLIACTVAEDVKTFAPSAKGWQQTHLLDTLHDYVSYIFEDKLQNVWLCSRGGSYKIETVDNAITDVSFIAIDNPSLDETVGLAYGNEVYIAASGRFNRYDSRKNNLTRYDSLPGVKKYFASAGYFWFYDGHRWRTVDPRMEKALKLQWLGLFHNVQFIAPIISEQGLWVITASNELYKFSINGLVKEAEGYPLFLREVRGEQKKLEPNKTLKISQLENTVEFEFIQPDYVGMRAVEYRYQVEGLSKSWSSWANTNNIVNFSYLPVGDYKVQVQTRDLMGKVSVIEEILLEIEPPYWKQTWFYALEVIFFGSLVFLSIQLSKANSKYKLLSRLLSMLTIIMLIQLVDNIVASQISISNGPVVEFFIQVIIAMLMLPIEGFLRKVITKNPLQIKQQG